MGNLNFTTPQVQQRLAQGYYDDIKVAGYTGTKAQLDAILAKAGVVMKAATASANGDAGLVPAPAKGAATRYLRSDGTWQVPPDNNTVYTHPTTAGNKHIPAGGVAGQFLKWSADGTAVWAEATGGSGNNSILDLTPFASIMDDPTLNGTPIQITQQIVDTVKKAYEDKLSTGLFANPLTAVDSANCYVPISISRVQEEGGTTFIIQLSLIFPSELLGMGPSMIAAYSAAIIVDYGALEAFAYVDTGFGGSGAGGGGVKLLPSGFVNLSGGTHNSADISRYIGGVEGFNRIYDDLEFDSNKTNYCSYWLASPYGVLQSSYAFAQSLGNGDKVIGFVFTLPTINSSEGKRSTTNTPIGITMSTNGTFSSDPQKGIVNCAREIFVNTTAPSSPNGEEGDIWIQYTP